MSKTNIYINETTTFKTKTKTKTTNNKTNIFICINI